MDDDQLRTVWQQRQLNDGVAHLSQSLMMLMKHKLAKKVRQLSSMAAIWDEVIPESIRDHTALESLQRGVLTVLVDSAAHRYQLQTLLTGGVMAEIQKRFPGGLDRIRLIPGQFHSVDVAGQPRYEL
jgi:predicted nucleic acid-binding Zn ribbon protein